MEGEWTTVSEELVLVHPSAPRYQTAISEKQADAVRQMASRGPVLIRVEEEGGSLQINSRLVEIREENVDSFSTIRVMGKPNDQTHAVKPLANLVELGRVQKIYRYDYEHLRPRSFGPLKGLNEEEHGLLEAHRSSDEEGQDDKLAKKSKVSSKAIRKSKDASKSIAEFTARCIKDLRKKLIKENALRKTSRARKVMLTKGKRAKIVRIAVEKVHGAR